MKTYDDFPSLLEAFFTDRLMRQRQASPHTLASYRDTFRLLLEYAERTLRKPPSTIRLEDLNAPFVGEFLSHLEKERGIAPEVSSIGVELVLVPFQPVSVQYSPMLSMKRKNSPMVVPRKSL